MLANWASGCWNKDGERVDEIELVDQSAAVLRGLVADARSRISVLKHYLVVERPMDRMAIHSGVVSLCGVTVVATTLEDVAGQSPNFGGAGIMFMVFAGADWIVSGPERLIAGGVGVFDPNGESDTLVYSKFSAWAKSLGAGPHVDTWVEKLMADGRWRLE